MVVFFIRMVIDFICRYDSVQKYYKRESKITVIIDVNRIKNLHTNPFLGFEYLRK